MDELIERLRERAADPRRRTDAPQGITMSGPGGTLTSMFGQLNPASGALNLSSLLGDLQRVVAANQAGRPIEPDLRAKVDSMAAGLSPTNETALPPPAEASILDSAESELGFALPGSLRRLYAEIADGGFGPGGGLLPIRRVVATYLELRSEPAGPRGQTWPEGLLPISDREPGYRCLEVSGGRVVDWDPEDLTERSGDAAWRRSFKPEADSLEAWLDGWLEAKPVQDALQERVNASMVEEARKARARIGAMTSAERTAMGLPEVGWERVVWGGLGLDPDD